MNKCKKTFQPLSKKALKKTVKSLNYRVMLKYFKESLKIMTNTRIKQQQTKIKIRNWSKRYNNYNPNLMSWKLRKEN
jgi:hypothetical protein